MNTLINDGGPAFPVADTKHWDGQIQYGTNGMSLRDWLAGQALAGIMTRNSSSASNSLNWVPVKAYALADAMLAARERKEDAK